MKLFTVTLSVGFADSVSTGDLCDTALSGGMPPAFSAAAPQRENQVIDICYTLASPFGRRVNTADGDGESTKAPTGQAGEMVASPTAMPK